MKQNNQNVDQINEISKQVGEAINIFMDAFSNEYEVIQTKFDAYFNKEGIITPYDVDDFLYWLYGQYPDDPTGHLVNRAKDRHNYKLFHQYEVSLFNGDIQNETTVTENKKNNFTARQWASIFHYSAGLDLPEKSNEVRERIKEFRSKHGCFNKQNKQISEDSLYNKYYEVKKQIDVSFVYNFAELEKIIPFMKKHYPNTIDTIKDDIKSLKYEQS
ncbi:MAG: hypothetical protein PHS04_18665 [Tissierellia bacterium]|nr:hypothetical protein [Tissierellia bacterium]